MRKKVMAKWIYCLDNKKLPEPGIPHVVLYRNRIADRIFGVYGMACIDIDLFDPTKKKWVDLSRIRDTCQPYAYLDLEGQEVNQELLHRIVKEGEVKL